MDSALENMRAASAHIHKLQGVSPDEVINVTVTCDDTWSKRGFTATYGVVVVIAWETGQVLDFQIKSKCYMACALELNSVDEDSKVFRMWCDGHRDVCGRNHVGSSPAMEGYAALEIWKRSEERLHLRFTEVISDRDSKTIAMLQKAKPYGENMMITKHECVRHVQKRLG